ncbi:hypothetical protein TSUD_65680 [Trifolium subterraneum]|uniref:Uncharacterized protein n=1 Tax=Trifolium subterraneum TaxID=3900 RepID=A0A2Z6MFK3_TRISU|nr:hypothetical protein TSUD_65680 [Trifolium subterraneum]
MEGKVVGNDGKLGSEVAAGNGGMLRDGSKGGKVFGFGKVGMVGKFGCVVVCKRWRASMLMLDIVTTRSKVVMKDLLGAIDSLMNCWEYICIERICFVVL